jgi:hypothetical protein
MLGALMMLLIASTPSAMGDATPQFVRVIVKNHAPEDRAFGISDTLRLEISGLTEWKKNVPADQRALVLYIDGVPFPESELARADDDKAEFRLDRKATDTASRDAWNRLLARPTSFSRVVTVAVGPKDKPPFVSADTDPKSPGIQPPTLKLTVLWQWGFWIYLVALGGICFAVWKLARESSLLRDGVPNDPKQLGTFSLGRCQMAFWFLVILSTYCFIWLATGAVDTLSTSALGLLGLSGGTGFLSILIDRSKQSQADQALQNAVNKQTEVKQDIQTTGGVASATQYQALANADKAIEEAKGQLKKLPSEGFFKDILTDANGVTVHRLQLVVWTVVLGIIFLVSVYQQLAMPELSGTLLGLMGLSSATYLGLKGPEKQQ